MHTLTNMKLWTLSFKLFIWFPFAFTELTDEKPKSVLLAEGSEIKVFEGSEIF